MTVFSRETRSLGTVPALFVHQGSRDDAVRKGTVLFYHGFSAEKEVNLTELEGLAAAGFLAIGLDNAGHGGRRLPDWEAHFGPDGDWEENFMALVRQSSAEVPTLVDELIEEDAIHEGRVGICGISMGGMIAFGALPLEPRLRAAVSIVSAPRTLSEADYAAIPPRAVLSQSAGRDEIVPHTEAEQFHQRLAGFYGDLPERNGFINYPDSGHTMDPDDWTEQVWPRTVAWFERFLPLPG